jgi:hypothetical protein
MREMTFPIVAALLLAAAANGQPPAWPCGAKVDPAYVEIAEATGGVLMLFKPTELEGSVAEDSASRRHEEVVFRASGTFDEGSYEYEIPVDSTVDSIYFYLAMQCLRDVTVIRPSGEAVRADTTGLESHSFSAVRLLVVPAPAPGLWKVNIAGRGFLSLVVKARSDLQLASVSFDNPVQLEREEKSRRVKLRLTGVAADIGAHLISSGGLAIARLDLTLDEESESSRTYTGEFTPPSEAFRVAITGVDGRGFRLQRVDRRLIDSER